MINARFCKQCCCDDLKLIENYNEAINDKMHTWELHHRLETHNSDGERRIIDISRDELKALDMYYNRPANELIFMTTKEHTSLHIKGKYVGEKNPFYGKKHSDETKNKISLANKGSHHTEEELKKMSEANIGKHWYNNGSKEVFRFECPEGFISGRIYHHRK